MYSVSFRIYLGDVAGAAQYVNGSFLSIPSILPERPVTVRLRGKSEPYAAEVIESAFTTRVEGSYKWERIDV
jgi:hypothetical protein